MSEPLYRANVLVCGGTGCEASGSASTYQMLVDEVRRRGLEDEVQVIHTGCRGFCAMGPIVIVYPEGIFYCQVHGEDIPLLVEETLVKGRIVPRLTYKEPSSHEAVPFYGEIPFYTKQLRITLRNCGMINPENIEEYIARDGYQALIKALGSMTPDEVITELKNSKLRGRGGAGFLVGLKWELTARAPGDGQQPEGMGNTRRHAGRANHGLDHGIADKASGAAHRAGRLVRRLQDGLDLVAQ